MPHFIFEHEGTVYVGKNFLETVCAAWEKYILQAEGCSDFRQSATITLFAEGFTSRGMLILRFEEALDLAQCTGAKDFIDELEDGLVDHPEPDNPVHELMTEAFIARCLESASQKAKKTMNGWLKSRGR